MHHKKIVKKLTRKRITIALILISLTLLFLTPVAELKDKFDGQGLATLLGALVVSEALFIGGIIVMALAVGHDVGKNPLKWRGHLEELAKKVVDDKWFWIGFWINAVGALVTGLILAFGIINYLPYQSWGLLWVAFIDIAITIALRYEIYKLSKEVEE